MDDGIEQAAEQGVAAFEAQQFPDPVPAMPPTPIGPPTQSAIPGMSPNDLFSRPHFMEGGWNVSADRMSWWNGVMWIPGRPPRSPNADVAGAGDQPIFASPAAPLVLFLVALAIVAVIAYFFLSAMQSGQTLTPPAP